MTTRRRKDAEQMSSQPFEIDDIVEFIEDPAFTSPQRVINIWWVSVGSKRQKGTGWRPGDGPHWQVETVWQQASGRWHSETVDAGELRHHAATHVASPVAGSETTTAPDDSKILALFREWTAATRAAVPLFGDDGESAEYEAAATAVDKLVSAILEIPSGGAVGLSIKCFLLIHERDGTAREDEAALSDQVTSWNTEVAAVIRDACRFVPELEPLTANALKKYQEGDDEYRRIADLMMPVQRRR